MAARSRREVRISREEIRRYRRLLDRQADKAADYIGRAIDAYMARHPGASTAQVRRFTLELLRDALPNFTDLAETLSCDLMEGIAEAHGWDRARPEVVGTTDYNLVGKRLHYLAGHLAGGDAVRYREGVLDATRFFIMRSAQDAMVENCRRAKLRYARVPSGFETCGFCFMLASRGFVYASEAKAGAGHAYHPNCNCTVVPGAKGRTAIDGYDPAGMKERWDECAKTAGSSDPGEIIKEVETRDWHWLYTGEETPWRLEKGADPDGKEKALADILQGHGFSIEFIKPIDKNRQRTADMTMNGVRWEMKNPDGSSGKAVKNQLKSAVGPKGKGQQCDRIVISNVSELTTLTFEQMCNQAQELWDANRFAEIAELLIVDKDGRMRRFKQR